jgi:LAS superfamily LD-carboxypeptidase LdcB
VHGLVQSFVDKLKQAFADNPAPCHVGSGFRTRDEQAALYRAKPHLAARPGHSNHERGLAADLSCENGGLAWLHSHASKYGLCFPMSYEAWHIEPVGITRYARRHTRYAYHYHRVKYASS